MENSALVMVSIIVAGFTVSVAAFCASIGNAVVTRQFIAGLTRQPEAKNVLLVNTLISVGLIEALPIIATVIALVLLYANPLLK